MKEKSTFLVLVNVHGSEKIKIFLIGWAKKRGQLKKQLQWNYALTID